MQCLLWTVMYCTERFHWYCISFLWSQGEEFEKDHKSWDKIGNREGIVIYCLGCCCLVAQAFVSHVFIGINSWDSLEDSSGLFIFRREEKFPRDLFSSFFSLSYYSYFFIDTFLMRTFFTGFFPIFSFLEFVDKDSWDNILWIR